MKRLANYLCVMAMAAAVAAPTAFAADKPVIVMGDTAHAKATVVNIKKKERELTLRNPSGAEFTVVATEDVRNFAQIKKGDVVELEYRVAVASALEKVSNTNAAGQATAVQRAPAGAKPGAVIAHTSTIIATVLEIDHKNRLLTAQGPRGNVVTVKVPPEIKTFDSLKKGDKISAIHSEALAISVKTPEKKK